MLNTVRKRFRQETLFWGLDENHAGLALLFLCAEFEPKRDHNVGGWLVRCSQFKFR